MLEVHKITLDKATKMLTALQKHTDVRWSITLDGETYGNAELATPKLSSRNYKYKRGETRAHYMPYLQNMEIGDTVTIPFDRFDPRILSTNIGSSCWSLWGNGSHTLTRLDTKGVVQVMRLA